MNYGRVLLIDIYTIDFSTFHNFLKENADQNKVWRVTEMSVLIKIFARPEMLWVGNVLHGIIKKKKKVSSSEKSPSLPCKGRQRVALTMLGETLHKLLYFSLLEGPILSKGGTQPLEAGTSPARGAGSGPHGLHTVLSAASSLAIHLFRGK